MNATGQAPRSRPGPKRNDATRRAILDAALALVREQGYSRTSIEGIAARAGSGKQTVYRWWRSKPEVILEALRASAREEIAVPDTGDLRMDLKRFLERTFAAGRREPYRSALPALMAAAQLDREFGATLWADFLNERREVLRAILQRAEKRSAWAPQIELETVLDIVFGTLWYRLLTGFASLGPRLAGELTETVMRLGQESSKS